MHTLNILFVLHVFSIFTSIHSPISTFKKSLTCDDLKKFIKEENFKYLIVEAINEKAYRFNLSNDVEKTAAIQVVNDKDNFAVFGWSIGENLPNWVKSIKDWMNYISVSTQVKNAGSKSFVDHDILRNGSDMNGVLQDDEASEKNINCNVVRTEISDNINVKAYLQPIL
jgi:hypothetical protein